MEILYLIFIFIFGAIIGSFLNVVILRYGTGLGVIGLNNRSKCFSCGRTLTVTDLVPILSFFFLGGKCKGCKSKISWQYPLVEVITAVLFTSVYLVYFDPAVPISLVFVLLLWIATAVLIAITAYDILHKIIPDGMVFTFAGIALLISVLSWQLHFYLGINDFTYPVLWNLLAGPIFFAFPFTSIWWISKGAAIGFGDAKLALGIGWLLGIWGGLSAVCLAFCIGAVISLCIMAFQKILGGLKNGHKQLTMKSEVPFAPYLVISFLLVLLANADFVNIVDKLTSVFR
ncbi:MAG: prepilin peptidase [Candidatus Taylorbacteria bacterium]|nr:prepilin peptidase [Candidatus Taylorbacteria bacterium]